MPLALKRKILQELERGCPTYSDRPEKQKEIIESYGEYLKGVSISNNLYMIYLILCLFSLHQKKLNGMDILFLRQ